MKWIWTAAASFLFSMQAYSAPAFTSITQDDYDKITKELSAGFTHQSLMGASSLGKIFGFEFGLVGGSTASPNIDSIVQRSSPGTTMANVYTGGLLLAVSVPFGLTGELVAVPKMGASGAQFETTSLGLKWSMDELVTVIPFNLALRGIYSSSKFSFDQVISGVTGTVSDTNKVTGLQILAGPKLPIFEPYVGVGFLQASNSLSVSGTPGTIFDPALTLSQSSDNSASSVQLLAGANVHLLFINLGLEYSQLFGASRYGAKLAFGF